MGSYRVVDVWYNIIVYLLEIYRLFCIQLFIKELYIFLLNGKIGDIVVIISLCVIAEHNVCIGFSYNMYYLLTGSILGITYQWFWNIKYLNIVSYLVIKMKMFLSNSPIWILLISLSLFHRHFLTFTFLDQITTRKFLNCLK